MPDLDADFKGGEFAGGRLLAAMKRSDMPGEALRQVFLETVEFGRVSLYLHLDSPIGQISNVSDDLVVCRNRTG